MVQLTKYFKTLIKNSLNSQQTVFAENQELKNLRTGTYKKNPADSPKVLNFGSFKVNDPELAIMYQQIGFEKQFSRTALLILKQLGELKDLEAEKEEENFKEVMLSLHEKLTQSDIQPTQKLSPENSRRLTAVKRNLSGIKNLVLKKTTEEKLKKIQSQLELVGKFGFQSFAEEVKKFIAIKKNRKQISKITEDSLRKYFEDRGEFPDLSLTMDLTDISYEREQKLKFVSGYMKASAKRLLQVKKTDQDSILKIKTILGDRCGVDRVEKVVLSADGTFIITGTEANKTQVKYSSGKELSNEIQSVTKEKLTSTEGKSTKNNSFILDMKEKDIYSVVEDLRVSYRQLMLKFEEIQQEIRNFLASGGHPSSSDPGEFRINIKDYSTAVQKYLLQEETIGRQIKERYGFPKLPWIAKTVGSRNSESLTFNSWGSDYKRVIEMFIAPLLFVYKNTKYQKENIVTSWEYDKLQELVKVIIEAQNPGLVLQDDVDLNSLTFNTAEKNESLYYSLTSRKKQKEKEISPNVVAVSMVINQLLSSLNSKATFVETKVEEAKECKRLVKEFLNKYPDAVSFKTGVYAELDNFQSITAPELAKVRDRLLKSKSSNSQEALRIIENKLDSYPIIVIWNCLGRYRSGQLSENELAELLKILRTCVETYKFELAQQVSEFLSVERGYYVSQAGFFGGDETIDNLMNNSSLESYRMAYETANSIAIALAVTELSEKKEIIGEDGIYAKQLQLLIEFAKQRKEDSSLSELKAEAEKLLPINQCKTMYQDNFSSIEGKSAFFKKLEELETKHVLPYIKIKQNYLEEYNKQVSKVKSKVKLSNEIRAELAEEAIANLAPEERTPEKIKEIKTVNGVVSITPDSFQDDIASAMKALTIARIQDNISKLERIKNFSAKDKKFSLGTNKENIDKLIEEGTALITSPDLSVEKSSYFESRVSNIVITLGSLDENEKLKDEFFKEIKSVTLSYKEKLKTISDQVKEVNKKIKTQQTETTQPQSATSTEQVSKLSTADFSEFITEVEKLKVKSESIRNIILNSSNNDKVKNDEKNNFANKEIQSLINELQSRKELTAVSEDIRFLQIYKNNLLKTNISGLEEEKKVLQESIVDTLETFEELASELVQKLRELPEVIKTTARQYIQFRQYGQHLKKYSQNLFELNEAIHNNETIEIIANSLGNLYNELPREDFQILVLATLAKVSDKNNVGYNTRRVRSCFAKRGISLDANYVSEFLIDVV